MQVISTVINPIPDEEGYHILECDECKQYFLINPKDILDESKLYCPYCGKLGDIIAFTSDIRNELFKEQLTKRDITEEHDLKNEELTKEKIKEILDNINLEDMDIEVLEYTIEEVIDEANLIKYEMICCDKSIKIPMDYYDKVNFCSFCKGEILLNRVE